MKTTNVGGTWLTVNRACNFRCIWCYAQGTQYNSKDDMPLDLAIKLVNLSAEIGSKEIIYIGGEPTLWKHLWVVDRHVHSIDMESALITNGFLLGTSSFAQRIADSQINFINISLKAGNPRQQKKLTLVAEKTFDTVIKGIRNASLMHNKEVNVSIVVSSLDIDNLVEIVERACESGVKDIFLQMCTPQFDQGTAKTGYMIHPDSLAHRLQNIYPKLHELTEGKLVIEGTIPLCTWDEEFARLLLEREQLALGCHVRNRSGLVLDHQGHVIMCNHLYDYPLAKYGKAFQDTESFINFWTSANMVSKYDEIVAYPTNRCVSCSKFDICGGGCPLQWFVYDPAKIIVGQGGA